MKTRNCLFLFYLVVIPIVSTNSWSDNTVNIEDIKKHIAFSGQKSPETTINIKDIEQRKAFSGQKSQEQSLTFVEELLELEKIIGMGVLGAVSYGISHDLITTQLNFAYFSDLNLTHHGRVTRDNFPYVYDSKSPFLYALLWGTIATWWVGLPLGYLSAVAARIGSTRLKFTWRDVIKPIGALMCTNLAVALINGGITYSSSGSSFAAVEAMHKSSYIGAAAGGLILPFYIYFSRLLKLKK